MGHSCSGKTVLAKELAMKHNAYCYMMDDFRYFLREIITPKINQGLYNALEDNYAITSQWSLQKRWQYHLELSKYLCHYVEVNLAHHLSVRSSIVLEGVYLLPRMADKKVLMYQSLAKKKVKSVVLVEHDDEWIYKSLIGRDRTRHCAVTLDKRPIAEQKSILQMIQMQRDYLLQNAPKHNVPVVASRPYDTLLQRVSEAIED